MRNIHIMMKISDIDLYMSFARDAANRSKAKRLLVGAVLVNDDGVMAIGINGMPRGASNVCETELGETKPEVLHAELNALFKFLNAGISTKGCSLFLTHSPCLPCAKMIMLAGISYVYYETEYRITDGIFFLEQHGVNVKNINTLSMPKDAYEKTNSQTSHNS